MMMREPLRAWTLGVVMLAVLCGLPSSALAGLYKYEGPDGSVLVTTQRRDDLKLIEVIEGDDPPARRSSSSRGASKRSARISKRKERFARYIEQAKEARDKHKAGKGVKEAYMDPDLLRGEAAFDDIIREASEAYGVPFAFIKAVIRIESSFNPKAISYAGAQGLMQLMPFTSKSLGVRDPFDPRQNIFGGTKLLKQLSDRYNGDINLILSAYNAGTGNVAKYRGIPFPTVRQYVADIYKWYKIYQSREQASAQAGQGS